MAENIVRGSGEGIKDLVWTYGYKFSSVLQALVGYMTAAQKQTKERKQINGQTDYPTDG